MYIFNNKHKLFKRGTIYLYQITNTPHGTQQTQRRTGRFTQKVYIQLILGKEGESQQTPSDKGRRNLIISIVTDHKLS